MNLNSTEDILDDLRAGRMVIIMDDENRENEGDLLILADKVRAEDINFMARYGRGLICLTLTQERCERLRLPLMVSRSNEAFGTNFTVSIEAAEGVTTGISAADRARTVQAAVAKDARPDDVVQPGHVFPLMARPGGVLTRAGHTEAGCDLARLAGAEPAAVIVEILNEDGSMARRPDLEKFAAEHGLKIGTIEDLIRYRLKHEHSVERVAESTFATRFGEFRLHAYQDSVDGLVHLALVKGVPKADEPTMVRVQVQNTLCDVLYGEQGCGWPLDDALQRIAQAECGVLVLLRPTEEPGDVVRRIQMLSIGNRAEEKFGEGAAQDQRTYGIGAQILLDLGVRKMHVMSAPKRFHALAGFGLEAVDYFSD